MIPHRIVGFLRVTEGPVLILLANLFFLGVLNKLVHPLGAIGALGVSPAWGLLLVMLASGLEIYLAVQLLLNPNRRHLGLATLLLAGFSAFLLLLVFRGELTCGCFDYVGWKRTPPMALLCNGVFLAYLGLHLWYGTRTEKSWPGNGKDWFTLLSFETHRTVRQPARLPQRQFSPAWLGLSLCLALYTQGSPLLHSKPDHLLAKAPISSGDSWKTVVQAYQVLLKVSPGCEHCEDYTEKILKLYSQDQVIGVTLMEDPEAAAVYTNKYHIPLLQLSLGDFARIGNKVTVPDGYQITPAGFTTLQPIAKLQFAGHQTDSK